MANARKLNYNIVMTTMCAGTIIYYMYDLYEGIMYNVYLLYIEVPIGYR
jgi:hypothetical protein